MCERIVYRHGAILLIVRECSGFNPRRWRHCGSWCAGQRTGRQWKIKGRSKRSIEGRQNEDQQRTLKHMTSWMACGWNECAPETPWATRWVYLSTVPGLVPVQLHEQPSPWGQEVLQLLIRLVRHAQINVGDVSKRSAVYGFLPSSSLVLELCAPHQRSPLPNTIGSPTRAGLLPEPVWHQTSRLHQRDAWPCLGLTTEKVHFLVDRLEFMSRLMSGWHSLQLVLQFANDSFSNSQALMSAFCEHCFVQAKCSTTKRVCVFFWCDRLGPHASSSVCTKGHN